MREHRKRQHSDSPRAPGGVPGYAGKQAGATHKPFAVFDIDGTLIRWQLYHALADALAKRGHIDAKTYADIRNARMQWKARISSNSFADYQSQVIKAYENSLLKLSPEHVQQAVNDVFSEYKDQVYTYTRDLIRQLKRRRYFLLAISGSQSEIVEKVADYYGFGDYVATRYRLEAGKLSKSFPASDKKAALANLIAKHQLSPKESVAVGDSLSDVPMLEAVDEPIVFNPEKELFAYAKAKGWPIVIERKNMVYQLEKLNGKYQLVKTN